VVVVGVSVEVPRVVGGSVVGAAVVGAAVVGAAVVGGSVVGSWFGPYDNPTLARHCTSGEATGYCVRSHGRPCPTALTRCSFSSADNSCGGRPADTYTVFTCDVGDWPEFLATGKPAEMYTVLAN